jgi:hypothetical protein
MSDDEPSKVCIVVTPTGPGPPFMLRVRQLLKLALRGLGLKCESIDYCDCSKNNEQQEHDMGRYSTDSGSSFTPAPAGTHVARCFKLIDLGTQHESYNGKQKLRNTLLIGWELPNEMNGERPHQASQFYTNSLNENSNLRADLESWFGRKLTEAETQRFDLASLIGQTCLLTIVENDKGKTAVKGVAAMPNGMPCPPPIIPPFTFWLDEFDQGKFDSLSAGLQ